MTKFLLQALMLLNICHGAIAAADAQPQPKLIATKSPILLNFANIWIVDRALENRWQVIADLRLQHPLDLVMFYGAGEAAFGAELDHLVNQIGEKKGKRPVLHWVGLSEKPTGLRVNQLHRPEEVGFPQTASIQVRVFNSDLEPIAALIALRLHGRVVSGYGPGPGGFIETGLRVEKIDGSSASIPTRAEALSYANRLARGAALMVTPKAHLKPENLLYAYYRDVKWQEVEPPRFDFTSASSEKSATLETKKQIQQAVKLVFGASFPQALVIAGQWDEIPYRYPKLNERCGLCDTQLTEYPSDLEYAALDDNPWGEPVVPVGRLASYHDDLLSIETLVGLISDRGALPVATKATYFDDWGGYYNDRTATEIARMQSVMPGTKWISLVNGLNPNPGPYLKADFMDSLASSGAAFIYADGVPDASTLRVSSISDAGVLSAGDFKPTALKALPAFYYVYACTMGKWIPPFWTSPDQDPTFITMLQRRLAFGAMLSVDMNLADYPLLLAQNLKPGKRAGDVVKDTLIQTIKILRGDTDLESWQNPQHLPPNFSFGKSAGTTKYWLGDPLTLIQLQ
jgi:hypothetical protein